MFFRGNLTSNISCDITSYVTDWHHVFVRRNSQEGNLSMYIDGSLVNQTSFGGNFNFGGSGFFYSPGITTTTAVDEVRLYLDDNATDNSLPNEIYSSGRIRNDSINSTNLLFWWSMNENQGIKVIDNLGYNNGTLLSGATWQNDGINRTMTSGIDYTLSGNTFTPINYNLAWTQMILDYSYNTQGIIKLAANDTITGIASFSDFWNIIIIAIVITIIIGLIMIAMTGSKKR